jgi:methyl-accepting chemotaxis protein
VTNPYRDAGLRQAFARAGSGKAGQAYFADFATYAPLEGAAASILATPVVNSADQIVGVVAFQIPSDHINAIVNNPTGLGETCELYIVVQDLFTCSASRFDGGFGILARVGELAQAQIAVEQTNAIILEARGMNGEMVLSSASQVAVFDQSWRIVGKIDRAEVNAPAVSVRNKIIILTIIVVFISTFLGLLTARSILRPLGQLGVAMQGVSQKNYDISVDGEARSDEIGILSRIVVQLRDRLQASGATEAERVAQQIEHS